LRFSKPNNLSCYHYSIMAFWKAVGAAGIASLSLSGCGGGDDDVTTTTTVPMPSNPTIADLVVATSDLGTLAAALTAADLVQTFNGSAKTKFTVFAPTNDAFAKVDKAVLDCLLQPLGIATLTEVLKNHVVAGAAMAKDLKTDTQLETLDMDKLNVTITDGKVMINDAMVIKADIMASNGVVHEVDGVLLPSNFMAPDCGTGTLAELVTSVATLSTLLAALTAADLVDTFSAKDGGPYTVFAPVDAAFAAVQPVVDCLLKPENKGDLTSVLTYHVLPTYVLAADIKNKATAVTLDDKETVVFKVSSTGKTVDVNGVKVSAPNNFANNGVAHIIDAVLVPSNLVNCTVAAVVEV